MKLPVFGKLVSRFRKPVQEELVTGASVADGDFHAVEVKSGLIACEAVMGIYGKRFLSKEAPALPLAGCDQSECTCGYMHRKDRRVGPRRDEDMGLPGFVNAVERRGSKARRTEDRKRASIHSADDYFAYATQGKLRREDLQAQVGEATGEFKVPGN